MMNVRFIRRVNGEVAQKGTTDYDALMAMSARHPGEYFMVDANDTSEVVRPKVPDLPVPEPSAEPTFEELVDAVVKLSKGDKTAIDAIDIRRKRKMGKAEAGGTDHGSTAQRSAGRNKAASK